MLSHFSQPPSTVARQTAVLRTSHPVLIVPDEAAFSTAALVVVAYLNGYATEGYEPHKL